jgi:HlyD family secretion protein
VKKALLIALIVGGIGSGGYAYYRYRSKPAAPTVNTSPITRGDVVDTVGATGTLQAVTTVQVGTQVSGTIQSLYADFNSLVKKGQVIARLDPSLFQTQIEQARANLIRAQADLERLRVSLEDAQTKLTRARELSSRELIPRSDLETAEVNAKSIEAQIRSSEAMVTQARASLNQNQVNLDHTVITAPIDGLVISRNVDVGQTVAASMQAPTLFVLAADLTKMQVVANLDESDVGRIRPAQHVAFRVDAFPTETFTGSVTQVRLQPIVQQNVVTYATVIDVPNSELKLKPGMTANVNIEINRRTNVLRLPNAALRFRPTNEIFAALGQPPLDPSQLRAFGQQGGPGRAPRGGTDASSAATSGQDGPSSTPPAADVTSSAADGVSPRARSQASDPPGQSPAGGAAQGSAGDGRPRGNRGALAERLRNMTPEERERALQQVRARGFDPTAARRDAGDSQPSSDGSGSARRRGRGGDQPPAAPQPPAKQPSAAAATTIDSLFAPLPPVEGVGRVWTYHDGQLMPTRVRTGVSDGQNTELLDGNLNEGAELVTNVITGTETRPAATSAFPGLGQPQRGGFPGGGFGGGGGGNRGGGGGGNRGR